MSNETLQKLHDKLAEVLAEAVTNGVPVKDEETGEIHKAPASAALMTVALALLKHNQITAVPTKKNGLGKLKNAMSSVPIPGSDMLKLMQDDAGK